MKIKYEIIIDKDNREITFDLITPDGKVEKDSVKLSEDSKDWTWELKGLRDSVWRELNQIFR